MAEIVDIKNGRRLTDRQFRSRIKEDHPAFRRVLRIIGPDGRLRIANDAERDQAAISWFRSAAGLGLCMELPASDRAAIRELVAVLNALNSRLARRESA